jgi:hypothetical protein
MGLLCPHGNKKKGKKRNYSKLKLKFASIEGSGKFPFNQLPIRDTYKYVILYHLFCSKLIVDIYTKLYILNFCSIFSRAIEIPNDKNRMNKVIT